MNSLKRIMVSDEKQQLNYTFSVAGDIPKTSTLARDSTQPPQVTESHLLLKRKRYFLKES
jgi:hypothetical protein